METLIIETSPLISDKARIGICLQPTEAFFFQVREALYRRSAAHSLTLLPFSGHYFPINPTRDEQDALLEEVSSQELDLLLGWDFPESLAYTVLDAGLPIVHLFETTIDHPLSVSPVGLQKASEELTAYLMAQRPEAREILVIGGLLQTDRCDDGISRVEGIKAVLRQHPATRFNHLSSFWDAARAAPQIRAGLKSCSQRIDAIIGLSDTLALLGRDIALDMGLCDKEVTVLGINGDPAAVAAIIKGTMLATMQTPAVEFGEQAFDIAMNILNGLPYPRHFDYQARLISAGNASEMAADTLVSISHLPALLAESGHREQQEHLRHMETSLHISHQIGTILDEQQFPIELAKLIRANYGYDDVQLALWSDNTRTLRVMNSSGPAASARSLLEAGILGEVYTRNEAIVIPDLQNSLRFEPDPEWPGTRTRVLVPIRHGAAILGLLDLHAHRVIYCTREHLLGLQSVADQVGVALQNLKLYQEALQAKVAAEKAEQLKTRLMANIGHELRSPLQIILGYTEQLADSSSSREVAGQIQHNAWHLLRLINDLLDLSRAEINELRILPQLIDPRGLLAETFDSIAATDHRESVEWCLQLADHLPLIQADPDRLRQILLNLLSNAKKFTAAGQITLGAELQSKQLHLWVADTGSGIPLEQQERIFEPFGSAHSRSDGIGLGLSITRRLVALHEGGLTVESRPGQGSIFHVYIPLPHLKDALPVPLLAQAPCATLFLISKRAAHPHIQEYCERESLAIQPIQSLDGLQEALAEGLPQALAWDIADNSSEIQQIIQYLYAHPILCETPFLLFDSARQNGDTQILLKPVRARNLLSFITATYYPADRGTILIVDDDPHARQFYADVITQHLPRYTVHRAEHGAEAIERMTANVPDLVILDLVMPEMDGFEVIEWMRAQPAVQHVPVVILSGKILSFENISRLRSHRKIAFQTKRILQEEELAALFQHAVVKDSSLTAETSAVAKQAVAYIQNHFDQNITRQDIAEAIGISENYLTQVFHDEMGIALWEYLNRYRINKSKDLLITTALTIAQVATHVGFDDPAYFSRVFRRHTGQSPRAYRKSS